MKKFLYLAVAGTALLTAACQPDTKTEAPESTHANVSTTTPVVADVKSAEPTVQDAKEFLETSAAELEASLLRQNKAGWVKANFITTDTGWLESQANAAAAKLSTRQSNEAKKFNDLKSLPADMLRKLDAIKRGSNFPAPDKPGAADELAKIMSDLDTQYGEGKFSLNGKVLNLGELSKIIATSRDPEELQAVWEGWRTISPPMQKDYARMVEIVNEGSKELGYADTGVLWKAGYDMPADDFTKEADRLWTQVKPLYDDLHCHVRAKLNEQYGDKVVPLDQPIRADLLGNMWAQSWGNVYDLVKPESDAPTVDITELLKKADYSELKMVKAGENFFTSLGFDPLPDTFWERSLFVKPADREVQCHASAWDIDDKDDIRIKMCIEKTGEDFKTIHHELGHNFYQRAYKNQPVFYKDGANDGFHEAIGDMISLSITPDYLVQIGLLDAADVPDASADINLLMQQALDKVAFLPFGIMIDKWRWNVFNGEYTPSEYNSGWWELRDFYQGVRPPAERPTDAFDPGAKFHIPGNTPYMRYFLAHILQFQFHKAACDMAGNESPLHRCSIYGNKEVGKRFDDMMRMGSSKPWPEALEAFTGTPKMDGSAIIEYFAPLQTYLKEQNKDRKCGW
ncbi:MAG: M2 family metallopeptidase [Robiginitomaculum sp.]|nr:M2 family metallopeptidase [Robiginitomaculum sp.]